MNWYIGDLGNLKSPFFANFQGFSISRNEVTTVKSLFWLVIEAFLAI